MWEIIHMVADFGPVQRLVEETHLDERQVPLALAYRDAHPEEITEAVAANQRPVAEWLERYPFVRFTPGP